MTGKRAQAQDGGVAVRVALAGHAPTPTDRVLNATNIPRSHWLLTCSPATAPQWQVLVGTNQARIEPSALISTAGMLFVGAEQGVFVLDALDGRLTGSVDDASYVQSIEGSPGGMVIVSAEDQLLAFHNDGALAWRTNLPDVIASVQEQDGALVEDMSGHCCHLDTETGQMARKA